MFGMGFLEVFILFLISIPLIALIDILRSEFNGYNKIIWVIVVIFLPVLGAVLYFFIGRKQKIK